jgi:RNA polymerase sigma-70 factor, ECF subfamily
MEARGIARTTPGETTATTTGSSGAGEPRMPGGGSGGEGSGPRLVGAPDEALARRAQRGDREALEHLVRRYLRPVHAVAASYLPERSDVEDVAQETFLRALAALESYDPGRPFAPWLYQIARNVARDRVSARSRRREESPSETLQSRLPTPDEELERSQVRARVRATIARLPERRRTAFYLHDVEGYGTMEVAGIMGISPGTVRAHVHHARTAVRAALAERREEVKTRRTAE